MRLLTILAISVGLFGCMNPAAKGPQFASLMQTNQNDALVYFFRPLENDGGTVCFKLFLNDLDKGCLGTKGFLGFNVGAGDYIVKIKPDAFPSHTLLELNLSFSSGDKRIFQVSIANSQDVPKSSLVSRYSVGGTWFVLEVPFSSAERELSGLNESVSP